MIEVILSAPITVIDQTVDRIQFRPAVGRDLIGLPNPAEDPAGWGIGLANRTATNVPPGTVLGLPMPDAFACGRAVAEPMAPTTPASSSTDTSSAPAGGTISTS